MAEPRSAALHGVLGGRVRSTPASLWMQLPGGLARGRVDRRCSASAASSRARTSIACRRGPPGTRRSRSCSSCSRPPRSGLCSPPLSAPATRDWLALAAATMAGTLIVVLALRILAAERIRQRRAAGDRTAARDDARRGICSRAACCSRFGAIALPLFTVNPRRCGWHSLLTLGGEILGRYLFFVSVVPKHMTAPYLGSEAA